jgi:hypothetical protein
MTSYGYLWDCATATMPNPRTDPQGAADVLQGWLETFCNRGGPQAVIDVLEEGLETWPEAAPGWLQQAGYTTAQEWGAAAHRGGVDAVRRALSNIPDWQERIVHIIDGTLPK